MMADKIEMLIIIVITLSDDVDSYFTDAGFWDWNETKQNRWMSEIFRTILSCCEGNK